MCAELSLSVQQPGKQKKKFSSFFKSLVIELDKELYGPDNHLVEVSTNKISAQTNKHVMSGLCRSSEMIEFLDQIKKEMQKFSLFAERQLKICNKKNYIFCENTVWMLIVGWVWWNWLKTLTLRFLNQNTIENLKEPKS